MPVDRSPSPSWKHRGFRRLLRAGQHQLQGIRHGLAHDSAIRQVSVAVFIGCGLALVLPVSTVEKLLLILPLLLVALVEYLNSAIEAVVDRVSMESHPLSKIAKDYASVAVAIAVLMSLLSWSLVLGPVFLMAWRG